jgi:succinoglycan biosynthesis protein ExoA
MLPFISVILPVRDERAMLPRLLDELMKQNYAADRYELIVVDGQSQDGTADLVRRRYEGKRIHVRVLDNPKARASAGRNLGIRAAAGDVILFIDGHCRVPSQNLLEDTAATLARTGAECLCRPQPLLAPSPTPAGEAIAQARASWLGRAGEPTPCDRENRGFTDPVRGGATYLRTVFHRVGFFDESFDGGEATEFNTRVRKAGLRAYGDPRLTVEYQPRGDVRSLFQQMVRNGRARVRLMRRHPDAYSPSQWAPGAILAAVAVAAPAWILLPHMAATLLSLPAAVFAALAAIASLHLGLRHGIYAAWKAPQIFAAIYCGLGTGLLAEAILPGQGAPAAEPEVLRPQRLEEAGSGSDTLAA